MGLLEHSTFADLEKSVENFFLNLQADSAVVLDHIPFPHGAVVVKEFFEVLKRYLESSVVYMYYLIRSILLQ